MTGVEAARPAAPGQGRVRVVRTGQSAPRPRGHGAFGIPLVNLIVVEVGLALALVLLAVAPRWWPVAALALTGGVVIAGVRRHGRWAPQWIVIGISFALRSRLRQTQLGPVGDDERLGREPDSAVTGPEDARVTVLRLFVDDLVVAAATTHGQQSVGMAWQRGTWTAVLLVEPRPALLAPVGTHAPLPLRALADCLADRGVVLDAIKVVSHCHPGTSRLAADAPAVAAYQEVLGPLPVVSRRATWITVQLDPQRCPAAVRQRGGGVAGAHRALLGAVSRVQGVLEVDGIGTRALGTDELLRAAVSCAELGPALGNGIDVQVREDWDGVSSGGVHHASYGISGWPAGAAELQGLTRVRALSTTLTLAMSPSGEDGRHGLAGILRVTARSAAQARAAGERARTAGEGAGLRLEALNGQQAAALTATLPVGGTA